MMIKEDWFKEWFDSEYYHTLYKNRDQKEAQGFIKKLMLQFNVQPGQKVIDIACGKGRHSTYINSLGFDVTGVDLSQESIDYANQNQSESLRFIRHDMRHPFIKEKFDFALNLFTSFGYFLDDQDNQNSISSMASNLKPGGFLVIDFLNVNKVTPNLPNQEVKNIDGISFEINKIVENGFITKSIKFTDKGQNYHFTEYVKNISKETFIEYLNKAKMELVHLFGDYQLNNFDSLNSDRLILISRKVA